MAIEYVANLHMHTPYSDGEWYHADIAAAAAKAGVDVICVTDHNVWVDGPERYYAFGDRRVLVLVGEGQRRAQMIEVVVPNGDRRSFALLLFL